MMSAQIGLEAGPGGPAGLRAEGTDLPEQGGRGGRGRGLWRSLGRSPCSCTDLYPIEILVLVKSSDLGFVK